MPLVTLAQVKAHLDIVGSNANQDTKLQLFLDAAESWFYSDIQRTRIEAGAVTEYVHGNQADTIMLMEYPIISVTEVRINADGVFTDPSSIVPATDYTISDEENCIVLRNSRFPAGINNIQVTYVAGYATVPVEIKLAVLWLVEWFYLHNNRKDMGRTNMSKQDESQGVLAAMPPMVTSILNLHRRTEAFISNRQVRRY